MKNIFFILMLLCSVTAFAQQDVKHKIVVQVTTNDSMAWKLLMNNLKNLKEGWGDQVQIEVVAFGPGIDLLVSAKTTEQKKLAEFSAKGVAFVACENTLRMKNIEKKALVSEAGFVPMGIGELVMKQEQGWSYFKAGF